MVQKGNFCFLAGKYETEDLVTQKGIACEVLRGDGASVFWVGERRRRCCSFLREWEQREGGEQSLTTASPSSTKKWGFIPSVGRGKPLFLLPGSQEGSLCWRNTCLSPSDDPAAGLFWCHRISCSSLMCQSILDVGFLHLLLCSGVER